MRLLRRIHAVSLQTKIVLPVTVILAVAFAGIAYATARILELQRYHSSHRSAVRVSGLIEAGLRQAMMSGKSAQTARVILNVSRAGDVSRVALRRRDGSYLVDTGTPSLQSQGHNAAPPPGSIESAEVGQYVRVTRTIANEPVCYGCHPPSQTALGYLDVEVPTGWLKQRIQRTQRLIAAASAVGMMLVGLAITWALNAAVLNPVRQLGTAMARVRAGERTVRVAEEPADEIGQVGEAFNAMVDQVAAAELALVENQQRLAKAEKLAGIGLMAAGVAHEINNPLTAVSMAAESLNNPALSEAQRERLTSLVLEGSQRIQAIVAELLTLDRKQLLNTAAHDTAAVVRQALHSVDVPETIRVHFRVKEELPPVLVDRDRVARAIGNIVRNAVQAMPDGGELTLSARADGELMRVTISDTGPGIAPDVARRIFDPFFSTREVGQGFGLGLAFAHNIVAQHGGEITLASKPPEGAVFVVTLPLAKDTAYDA